MSNAETYYAKERPSGDGCRTDIQDLVVDCKRATPLGELKIKQRIQRQQLYLLPSPELKVRRFCCILFPSLLVAFQYCNILSLVHFLKKVCLHVWVSGYP